MASDCNDVDIAGDDNDDGGNVDSADDRNDTVAIGIVGGTVDDDSVVVSVSDDRSHSNDILEFVINVEWRFSTGSGMFQDPTDSRIELHCKISLPIEKTYFYFSLKLWEKTVNALLWWWHCTHYKYTYRKKILITFFFVTIIDTCTIIQTFLKCNVCTGF